MQTIKKGSRQCRRPLIKLRLNCKNRNNLSLHHNHSFNRFSVSHIFVGLVNVFQCVRLSEHFSRIDLTVQNCFQQDFFVISGARSWSASHCQVGHPIVTNIDVSCMRYADSSDNSTWTRNFLCFHSPQLHKYCCFHLIVPFSIKKMMLHIHQKINYLQFYYIPQS